MADFPGLKKRFLSLEDHSSETGGRSVFSFAQIDFLEFYGCVA